MKMCAIVTPAERHEKQQHIAKHQNMFRSEERENERKGKIENASVDETEVFGSNWILANYGCSKDILCSYSSVHQKPSLLKPRERSAPTDR
jgi:hypothetical protein